MELSLLCNAKVVLIVFDKNEKMLVYTSEKSTIEEMKDYFNCENCTKEYFTNIHHKDLFEDITKQTEFSESKKEQADQSLLNHPIMILFLKKK